MKIEIFKRQKTFRKGGFHINPDLYWEIVLYIAFAVIVASFIFGLYLFLQISKEVALPDAESGQQAQIIKQERINKDLEYFSLREEKSADVLSSPSPIIDPSI